jgi:hypothetical protein
MFTLAIAVILSTLGLPGTAGVYEGPVPRAQCGPGSRPETALQGSVPVADRASGRSAQGYTCNAELVGHYGPAQGFEGAEWQMAWSDHCVYYDTKVYGTQARRGTVVVDASDPTRPRFATNVTSPAMLDPWESLRVNESRGLLGGVFTAGLQGAGYFDVYDVKIDCAQPKLLASLPVNGLGHEGSWSPDGRTYYATGVSPGIVTAIDVSDPRAPKLLTRFAASVWIHGLGISPDGNRLYLAHMNEDVLASVAGEGSVTDSNGLGIYDISQINARTPNAQVRLVGKVTWRDGAAGQHAIPITSDGRPYTVFVDELHHGGPRIVDIADETKPFVVSKLRLEIQMPENLELANRETNWNNEHGGQIPFGYNTHYCNTDRTEDPTILACSTFESGLRVFDIRDVRAPREIAYFNPGGDGRRAPASFGGTTGGYTTAQPRIIPQRQEIWFTDQDRGVYIIRLSNGSWPA